ncbi:MAG: hypothetical protein AB7O98_09405 [Hyphomonadaceae bacterium]
MRLTVMVLAAALLAAAPAFAQTEPVAPPEATAQDGAAPVETAQADQAAATEDPDDQMVCRTVQRSESRLRTRRERICATRTQWEVMQDQTAQDVRNVGTVQRRTQ